MSWDLPINIVWFWSLLCDRWCHCVWFTLTVVLFVIQPWVCLIVNNLFYVHYLISKNIIFIITTVCFYYGLNIWPWTEAFLISWNFVDRDVQWCFLNSQVVFESLPITWWCGAIPQNGYLISSAIMELKIFIAVTMKACYQTMFCGNVAVFLFL